MITGFSNKKGIYKVLPNEGRWLLLIETKQTDEKTNKQTKDNRPKMESLILSPTSLTQELITYSAFP